MGRQDNSDKEKKALFERSDPNLQSVVILSPDCGFVRKLESWMSPSSSSSSSSSIGAVI